MTNDEATGDGFDAEGNVDTDTPKDTTNVLNSDKAGASATNTKHSS